MSLFEFTRWISYLTTLGSVCLLARLGWLGLARRYGCLAGYLLTDVLQAVLVIGRPPYSVWYGNVYFASQAGKSILAIGFSVQLWLLALRGYPGVARYGRRMAFYLLLGTLGLALAGLLLEPPRTGSQGPFSHYFFAIEGALDSMVGLFLVVATLFLLWFPVEVSRNVALIMGAFVFYLAQGWAGLLLVNLYPKSMYSVNAGMLSLELACWIFLIVTVRRQGETTKTVTGHRWNPEETERLLGQLDAINQRLEQASR
jgi:hypothetical protein